MEHVRGQARRRLDSIVLSMYQYGGLVQTSVVEYYDGDMLISSTPWPNPSKLEIKMTLTILIVICSCSLDSNLDESKFSADWLILGP
jgi:endonuclease IV